MKKATDVTAPQRPITHEEVEEFDQEVCLDQEQVAASLQLIEVFSELRTAGICSNHQDCLNPKESAAYAAALHKIEVFIDRQPSV